MSAALDADADANADALTTALLASAGVDRASRRGRPSRARALNQQDDSELFLEHDPLLEDSSTSGEDARDDEDGRENDEDVERASSRDVDGSDERTGDVATVLALWNSMVGSAVLAAPWAFTESGVALGVGLAIGLGGVMAYTCALVLRYGVRGDHEDAASVCGAHLGSWARVGCNVAMAAMMTQCVVVFDMMLSTSVYGIVKGFEDLAKGGGEPRAERLNFLAAAMVGSSNSTDSRGGWATCTDSIRDAAKCWNPYTAVLVSAAVLMLLGSIRKLDVFVSMSVLGPFFMTYLICFIIFQSVVATPPEAPIEPYANFVTFKKTAGVLTTCLFSHHAVIPVCRANRKSKNNVRNLFIAYGLTLLSYTVPAVAGNFSAAYVSTRRGPHGSSRAANFLRVFPPSDYYTLSAHIAVTVQFLTMVPLLMYILRTQVIGLLPKLNAKTESTVSFLINAGVIALGSFCAAQPHIDIGVILSKCGAVFGLIFAYASPVLVHVFGRRGARHPWWNNLIHGVILALGVAVAVSQFTG